MKYILYFKENSNNFNQDIVFDNDKWTIIKPSSYESCCYWGQDTDWRVSDGTHEYYFNKESSYIVIEKESSDKYFLNFHSGDFEDKDEDKIYLKEFLDKDSVLYNFFGERIKCDHVKEVNGEWWIVVSDYDFFESYFKLDSRTRNDLIKDILGGDPSVSYYEMKDIDITDESAKLRDNNLLYLKIVLRLEQDKNGYDFDINDIKNYDDVAEVVNEYDIDNLKKAIKSAFCEAHEGADDSAAWNDVIKNIYDFFELVDGSAKWETTEGYKYQALWIKFKSKSDAIRAKFIITEYDDSFDDDIIDYSPPYYGYSGESEDVESGFNECIEDKIAHYYEGADISIEEINDYYEYWQEEKKKNPNATDDEIAEEVKYLLDAKKYNL